MSLWIVTGIPVCLYLTQVVHALAMVTGLFFILPLLVIIISYTILTITVKKASIKTRRFSTHGIKKVRIMLQLLYIFKVALSMVVVGGSYSKAIVQCWGISFCLFIFGKQYPLISDTISGPSITRLAVHWRKAFARNLFYKYFTAVHQPCNIFHLYFSHCLRNSIINVAYTILSPYRWVVFSINIHYWMHE